MNRNRDSKEKVLKETFTDLLAKYSVEDGLIVELWNEIEEKYSTPKRHYHTLKHLENILAQLNEVEEQVQDWQTILFTLYYHDIIYNPLRADNEEKSADLAAKRMKQISVPDQTIKLCKEQILATKAHFKSADSDTNHFIDADLSILGHPCETYLEYCKNIRKEYSIYPDLVYNPGRKKVINHFLAMDRIFKTPFFYDKFEVQAKQNLQKEIELIDGCLKK